MTIVLPIKVQANTNETDLCAKFMSEAVPEINKICEQYAKNVSIDVSISMSANA